MITLHPSYFHIIKLVLIRDLPEFLHLCSSLWTGVHLDHILVYFFTFNSVEAVELLGGGTREDDRGKISNKLNFDLLYSTHDLLLLSHLKL